jgi:hypothetical protein
MTASEELANLFKRISEEVDSWEPWKRSLDPHGSDNEEFHERSSYCGDEGWHGFEPKVEA